MDCARLLDLEEGGSLEGGVEKVFVLVGRNDVELKTAGGRAESSLSARKLAPRYQVGISGL
jgi:hypothetical protein